MNKYFLLWLIMLPISLSFAHPLELQTYWTSPSEQTALNVIIHAMHKQGQTVTSTQIKGAGGFNNYIMLQRQTIAQQLPDVAQMEGPSIKEWAQLGLLNNLPHASWFNKLPNTLKSDILYQQHYIAIPIALYRTNALWINPHPFQQLHLPYPTSLDDLLKDAKRLQHAGYLPFAFSKEDWQEASLFENLLLSSQGNRFYTQVFIQQKSEAILSDKMTSTLQRLRHFYQFADQGMSKRSWADSTSLFAEGKAAMIIGGDWIKGELEQQGLQPDHDFLCHIFPNTQHTFIYNVDNFVMVNQPHVDGLTQAQYNLLMLLMSPSFQIQFNIAKGAMPPQLDTPLTAFDHCTQQEKIDFTTAEQQHSALPSMANSMATDTQKKMIFFSVLHYFLQHPEQTPQQAQSQLNAAFRAIET